MGLALAINLKFCTGVAKGLKLNVRKFWGPKFTFVEVTGEKLVGLMIYCKELKVKKWSFKFEKIHRKKRVIESLKGEILAQVFSCEF